MSSSSNGPTVAPWTDQQLDGALTELRAAYESSEDDLAVLRQRIVPATSRYDVDRPDLDRRRRSRRRRRLIASGAVLLACGIGGGAAAATGVFEQQTRAAFASGNTYPYDIDSHTAIERIAATTPDGGHAEYWTAKTGDVRCSAVLLDDPGQRFPGKPYLPHANCSEASTNGYGELWMSARTGKSYMMFYARVDTDATTLTFISPLDASVTATTPVIDGYYLVFLPYLPDPGGDYGINETHADGRVTVFQKPWSGAPESAAPTPSPQH
jgi:hypothetical protein